MKNTLTNERGKKRKIKWGNKLRKNKNCGGNRNKKFKHIGAGLKNWWINWGWNTCLVHKVRPQSIFGTWSCKKQALLLIPSTSI